MGKAWATEIVGWENGRTGCSIPPKSDVSISSAHLCGDSGVDASLVVENRRSARVGREARFDGAQPARERWDALSGATVRSYRAAPISPWTS